MWLYYKNILNGGTGKFKVGFFDTLFSSASGFVEFCNQQARNKAGNHSYLTLALGGFSNINKPTEEESFRNYCNTASQNNAGQGNRTELYADEAMTQKLNLHLFYRWAGQGRQEHDLCITNSNKIEDSISIITFAIPDDWGYDVGMVTPYLDRWRPYDTGLDGIVLGMLDAEKELTKGELVGVSCPFNTLGYSMALLPFYPIKINDYLEGGYSSINYWYGIPSGLAKHVAMGSLFVNAASFFWMAKGSLPIPTEEITAPGGKFVPCRMYNPNDFNNVFQYTPGTEDRVYYDGYELSSNTETFNDLTINETMSLRPRFVQIGDPLVLMPGATTEGSSISVIAEKYLNLPVHAGNYQLYGVFENNGVNTGSVYRYSSAALLPVQMGNSLQVLANCLYYEDDVALSNISGTSDVIPMFMFYSEYGKPNNDTVMTVQASRGDDGVGYYTGRGLNDTFYGGVNVGDEGAPDPSPDLSGGGVAPDLPDIPDDNPDDPTGGLSPAKPIGGGGTWSDTSVNTAAGSAVMVMPNGLGVAGNAITVKMNSASVASLAAQSWRSDGWLQFVKDIAGRSAIAEGVVDVKTCFCNIPNQGGSQAVGAIAGFAIAEAIPCNVVNQYNEFDFGYVEFTPYFGNFLDFSPYTEIEVVLPFAECVKIPPELVQGRKLYITLRVDVVNGIALYVLDNGEKLIAQVPASIFVNIPFASSEYTETRISAMMGFIGNVNSAVASGVGGNAMGTAAGVSGGILDFAGKPYSAEASRKVTQISGGSPSFSGAMGNKNAVVKISRPYVLLPDRYYELNGAPSSQIVELGKCSGYFEVGVFKGQISCSEDEYNAIVEQLRSGVIP